jgi:hypothetical protein
MQAQIYETAALSPSINLPGYVQRFSYKFLDRMGMQMDSVQALASLKS